MTAEEMKWTFPDGRIGAASWLASKEKGALLFEITIETVSERVKELQTFSLPQAKEK